MDYKKLSKAQLEKELLLQQSRYDKKHRHMKSMNPFVKITSKPDMPNDHQDDPKSPEQIDIFYPGLFI